MNGRFYILGAIVSLVLHGAFFFLLAVGSCTAETTEKNEPADIPPAVVETNAAPPVVAKPVVAKPVVAKPVVAKPVLTDPFAVDEAPVVPKPVAARPTAPEPSEKEREWKTYVVKKGDTLTILSKKAGCSVSEIAKRNKKTVAQMAKLWVGQKIRLPPLAD